MAETIEFQTEVNHLLQLVIHSLYSNKEIFLRELVSNSSDALDKLRFLALSNGDLYEDNPDLKITITFDKEAKTLTVSDNGIGMTKDEIITNLGTIAKSGTKEFLSKLTGDEAKDSHLIGQFGVGFYSAFIVADTVSVISRKAGLAANEGVKWTSKGEANYELEAYSKNSRGTDIILHLKDDAEEFLNDWQIKNIISKYSDHICWPIQMEKTEIESEEDKKDAKKDENKAPEFETVNKATALWTMSKSEINEEDYKELYKHISHDFEEPLLWAHNHVEGKQDYISLFYIPQRAPFDLYNQDNKHGLKLYVKRVFIMDDADQFLPRYLRFVKGIIDSSDLPLNVSREILQDNKIISSIKSASVKRILTTLEKLGRDDKEKYQKFWDNFGPVLKEGPIEDFANKEKVASLLRFSTTKTDSEIQDVSLDDYISRMDEKQEKIYYVTASSFLAAKNSPHLEYFRNKGIEVLLLSDRVDEWLVSHLSDYKGKHLQSVAKGNLDVSDDEKKENKEEEKKFDSVVKQMTEVLKEKAKEVRLSHRLTDSPACVVADDHDMGLEMQRIMQAAGQNAPASKPIFEINASHPLVAQLHEQTDDDLFKAWTLQLFDQAILAEGGELENPADFVKRTNQLLQQKN